MTPEGFDEFSFSSDGATRRVFFLGTGPGVVLMHEVPGLTPKCLQLGTRIAEAGFRVFLPLMFGEPGQHGDWFGGGLKLCLVKEFKAFAANESQPITAWMRALCREAQSRSGGGGVGVVGLCLSGGLVFALIAEPAVRAAVTSEPAVPIPLTPEGRTEIGISPEELAEASARVIADGTPILGLRFSNDWICPKERFERIELEFSRGFVSPPIVIDSGHGNPAGIPAHAHAVLTEDFVDRPGHPTRFALDSVLSFLRTHLV